MSAHALALTTAALALLAVFITTTFTLCHIRLLRGTGGIRTPRTTSAALRFSRPLHTPMLAAPPAGFISDGDTGSINALGICAESGGIEPLPLTRLPGSNRPQAQPDITLQRGFWAMVPNDGNPQPLECPTGVEPAITGVAIRCLTVQPRAHAPQKLMCLLPSGPGPS